MTKSEICAFSALPASPQDTLSLLPISSKGLNIMNYIVVVSQARFDIMAVAWLLKNVSDQNQRWKVEPDMWERRIVSFVNYEDSLKFKQFINP
jgi:hypothetical protein